MTWQKVLDICGYIGVAIMTLMIIGFVVTVLSTASSCAKEQKNGVWYKEYELSVKCPNDVYDGNVYQMGHSSATIYSIWYVEKESKLKIDLPDGCVKIRISELPKPVRVQKN